MSLPHAGGVAQCLSHLALRRYVDLVSQWQIVLRQEQPHRHAGRALQARTPGCLPSPTSAANTATASSRAWSVTGFPHLPGPAKTASPSWTAPSWSATSCADDCPWSSRPAQLPTACRAMCPRAGAHLSVDLLTLDVHASVIARLDEPGTTVRVAPGATATKRCSTMQDR